MRMWRTIRNRHATATVALAWTALGFGLQVTSAANKQNILREVEAFHLSIENLRKAARAGRALDKLSETAPSLRKAMQFTKSAGLLSIDETVSQIDDHPQARTVIESAGLSTRKYVLTMYCFEQSAQALFLKDNSDEKRHTPGASKENVAFVKKNLKEINRLFSQDP